MSSTDTNRRIPSTATVLIALALAFLAAIAMAACAPADLPTAPDTEEAFPIASASAREGSPTLTEGGKAETTWGGCPSQAIDGVACSVGPDGYATLYSTDDNLVEGDRVFTRRAVPLKSGGSLNATITVEDDDIAYLSFRSRVTGSSWSKRADHDDRQFPLALICQHWHDVNGSNEIGAAGWVDIVPTLCSRDYQYIWEYLGTQTAWIDCTVGDAVTSTTMRYQTNQAWVDGTLWPAYRGGCYTYSQTKEWFVSLSKPVQMTAPTRPSIAVWVKPDYWHLLVTRTNHLRIPMTNYRTDDGDWRLSDLVRSDGHGNEYTGADRCGDMTAGIDTYTHGLNGAQRDFINAPQIIVDIPDGADLCHP